ncbi:MAG: addiction module protein [Gemmataceae bacterium]
MTQILQELKNAAATLPVAERAEFLLQSLNEKMAPEVRSDWLALAESRMAEIKSDHVNGIPADDVHRTLLGPRR